MKLYAGGQQHLIGSDCLALLEQCVVLKSSMIGQWLNSTSFIIITLALPCCPNTHLIDLSSLLLKAVLWVCSCDSQACLFLTGSALPPVSSIAFSQLICSNSVWPPSSRPAPGCSMKNNRALLGVHIITNCKSWGVE